MRERIKHDKKIEDEREDLPSGQVVDDFIVSTVLNTEEGGKEAERVLADLMSEDLARAESNLSSKRLTLEARLVQLKNELNSWDKPLKVAFNPEKKFSERRRLKAEIQEVVDELEILEALENKSELGDVPGQQFNLKKFEKYFSESGKLIASREKLKSQIKALAKAKDERSKTKLEVFNLKLDLVREELDLASDRLLAVSEGKEVKGGPLSSEEKVNKKLAIRLVAPVLDKEREDIESLIKNVLEGILLEKPIKDGEQEGENGSARRKIFENSLERIMHQIKVLLFSKMSEAANLEFQKTGVMLGSLVGREVRKMAEVVFKDIEERREEIVKKRKERLATRERLREVLEQKFSEHNKAIRDMLIDYLTKAVDHYLPKGSIFSPSYDIRQEIINMIYRPAFFIQNLILDNLGEEDRKNCKEFGQDLIQKKIGILAEDLLKSEGQKIFEKLKASINAENLLDGEGMKHLRQEIESQTKALLSKDGRMAYKGSGLGDLSYWVGREELINKVTFTVLPAIHNFLFEHAKGPEEKERLRAVRMDGTGVMNNLVQHETEKFIKEKIEELRRTRAEELLTEDGLTVLRRNLVKAQVDVCMDIDFRGWKIADLDDKYIAELADYAYENVRKFQQAHVSDHYVKNEEAKRQLEKDEIWSYLVREEVDRYITRARLESQVENYIHNKYILEGDTKKMMDEVVSKLCTEEELGERGFRAVREKAGEVVKEVISRLSKSRNDPSDLGEILIKKGWFTWEEIFGIQTRKVVDQLISSKEFKKKYPGKSLRERASRWIKEKISYFSKEKLSEEDKIRTLLGDEVANKVELEFAKILFDNMAESGITLANRRGMLSSDAMARTGFIEKMHEKALDKLMPYIKQILLGPKKEVLEKLRETPLELGEVEAELEANRLISEKLGKMVGDFLYDDQYARSLKLKLLVAKKMKEPLEHEKRFPVLEEYLSQEVSAKVWRLVFEQYPSALKKFGVKNISALDYEEHNKFCLGLVTEALRQIGEINLSSEQKKDLSEKGWNDPGWLIRVRVADILNAIREFETSFEDVQSPNSFSFPIEIELIVKFFKFIYNTFFFDSGAAVPKASTLEKNAHEEQVFEYFLGNKAHNDLVNIVRTKVLEYFEQQKPDINKIIEEGDKSGDISNEIASDTVGHYELRVLPNLDSVRREELGNYRLRLMKHISNLARVTAVDLIQDIRVGERKKKTEYLVGRM